MDAETFARHMASLLKERSGLAEQLADVDRRIIDLRSRYAAGFAPLQINDIIRVRNVLCRVDTIHPVHRPDGKLDWQIEGTRLTQKLEVHRRTSHRVKMHLGTNWELVQSGA